MSLREVFPNLFIYRTRESSPDILNKYVLHRQNFTFENFAQENGQKICKHAQKVSIDLQQVWELNKIMNFPACTYKSQN